MTRLPSSERLCRSHSQSPGTPLLQRIEDGIVTIVQFRDYRYSVGRRYMHAIIYRATCIGMRVKNLAYLVELVSD